MSEPNEVLDPQELTISVDKDRAVYFHASIPANVRLLELVFPNGAWIHDEDGRPGYRVPHLRAGREPFVPDRGI